MHCYRSEGYPKPSRPGSSSPACHRPATARKPRSPSPTSTSDSPITKGIENWTTIKEELYNNSAGKLLDTAHPAGPRQAGDARQARDETDERLRRRLDQHYNGKKVFATTLGHNNADRR